jgi:hypothetical protein
MKKRAQAAPTRRRGQHLSTGTAIACGAPWGLLGAELDTLIK